MVPVKSHKPMLGAVNGVTGGESPTLSKIEISERNPFSVSTCTISHRLEMMGKGQVGSKSSAV